MSEAQAASLRLAGRPRHGRASVLSPGVHVPAHFREQAGEVLPGTGDEVDVCV